MFVLVYKNPCKRVFEIVLVVFLEILPVSGIRKKSIPTILMTRKKF